MKQIIKQLSIKLFQIFFPVFLIVLAIAIAIAPIILTAVLQDGWIMMGILITIPLAIALIGTVNNTTNWYTVWDFDDLQETIEKYKTRPRKATCDNNNNYSTPD